MGNRRYGRMGAEVSVPRSQRTTTAAMSDTQPEDDNGIRCFVIRQHQNKIDINRINLLGIIRFAPGEGVGSSAPFHQFAAGQCGDETEVMFHRCKSKHSPGLLRARFAKSERHRQEQAAP